METKLKTPLIRCIVKLVAGGDDDVRIFFIWAIACMDWSKHPGYSENLNRVDDGFKQQQALDYNSFVVIHGAGSFGHFQACKSSVHKRGLSKPLVKAGFVTTRISVTSLNLEIVRALAREGIPSVAMSPFSCGWSTRDRNIASTVVALDTGFVPVLHGDAVLDESLGCTILSGDVIISYLAAHLKPHSLFSLYPSPPLAFLFSNINILKPK